MHEPYEPKSSNVELAPGHSAACSQCRDNIKDNDLFDKLSGVLMVSGFETTLIEVMLKEMYCRDKKTIAKYDNIRSMAIMKVKKQFGEIQAGKNLELQETIRRLSNELERLSREVDVLSQEKTTLQEKNKNLHEKLATSEADYNGIAVALKSYVKLNEWHEKLVLEVPVIRKKNSGIIRVQTWESAVDFYINDNPKPKVNKVVIDDF